MPFTEEQLAVYAEYFTILANIKRRLILEGKWEKVKAEMEEERRLKAQKSHPKKPVN